MAYLNLKEQKRLYRYYSPLDQAFHRLTVTVQNGVKTFSSLHPDLTEIPQNHQKKI